MLKNILNQAGVKKLDNVQKRFINGGDQTPGMGYCYDPETWWYEHPCGQVCNDGVSYPEYC